MKDSRIQYENKAYARLDLRNEIIVEDRAEKDGERRKHPERNKIAVCKRDNAKHDKTCKRADSVLGAVRAVL